MSTTVKWVMGVGLTVVGLFFVWVIYVVTCQKDKVQVVEPGMSNQVTNGKPRELDPSSSSDSSDSDHDSKPQQQAEDDTYPVVANPYHDYSGAGLPVQPPPSYNDLLESTAPEEEMAEQ